VEPPSIFALANFSLNLPFLVYGDIPTIVMDVNSGNDPFCVVEISPFQLENKGNEANPNIPTFAHVNLTVVDSRMFMDKMAAMNSIDEVRLDEERRTEGWTESWSEATARAISNTLSSRFAHRRWSSGSLVPTRWD